MTETQDHVAAASGNQEKVQLYNTSAYDAITEVISHGIKHFPYLDEFFQRHIGKKGYWNSSYKFCYPTALLNYAKIGPCEEAYKTRTDILNEISEERQRYKAEPYFYKVYELLDELNMVYPFIFKEKSCFDCQLQISHNLRSINLLNLSRNTCIWKNYKILQPMLDRYFAFARKTKQCRRCRENYDSYYVEPVPLLCINLEILYKCIYENVGNVPTNGDILLAAVCNNMLKNSLDTLPRRLTVQESTYVLYGVIERCKVNEEVHYVAYCRNLDDTWVRRDSFKGEKKLLTDLSIDTIALIFYENIGCWDKSQRKLLLKPARSAWHELTDVELPELCVEKIFSFLDNWGLKALIRSVEEKTVGCHVIMSSPSVTEAEQDDMSVFSFRSDSLEYKEQDRCSRNVLIHNLPTGDDISDVDRVKSLLTSTTNLSRFMNLDKIYVRRYREKMMSDEFPITVVTFPNQVEADLCISMHHKLLCKGIKIEGDYTNWQKEQLKKLKDIAKRHNQANPDDRKAAFIKSGVPVLVKKRNRPRAKVESSKSNVEGSEASENRDDVVDEKKNCNTLKKKIVEK